MSNNKTLPSPLIELLSPRLLRARWLNALCLHTKFCPELVIVLVYAILLTSGAYFVPIAFQGIL